MTNPMTIKQLEKIYSGIIYADESVLAHAPETTGDLEFFTVGEVILDDELEKEYESRGLVPAGINQLAAWSEANQDDKREHFTTHWKDAKGKWCYAVFDRWRGGERRVRVDRSGSVWDDGWWFAGSRKSSALESKPSSDTLTLALRAVKDAGYIVMKGELL